MYAKVLCLALPAVANAMGVIIDVDRKVCQGPDGASPTETVWEEAAAKEECIANCQSYSELSGNDCQRLIVWKDDCGADTSDICGDFTGSDNCWCNYQSENACVCNCYHSPIPDWLEIIDPQGGTYPVPDWDAISPCEWGE